VLEQHLCGKVKFPLYLRSISQKDIEVHGCEAHYNPDLSIIGRQAVSFEWKLIHSLGNSSHNYWNQSQNQSDWMRKKRICIRKWHPVRVLLTLLTNIPTLWMLLVHHVTLFDEMKWNIEES